MKVKCWFITNYYIPRHPDYQEELMFLLHVSGIEGLEGEQDDHFLIAMNQRKYLIVINAIGNPIGKEFYFKWDYDNKNKPLVDLDEPWWEKDEK